MSCPYSEYRASGVEWLSDIPEHWELARIADIFAARSGGTPSTSEDTYWEGDIPWVSAKDMKTLWIADTQDHISEEAVNASATTLVPPGTVLLVARSGILRHTLPVGLAQCEVAINQDIKGLIPSMELVELLYFVYWVYGLQAALLTLWRQQGATVESLDFDSVRATTCSLPPLHEQREISAFLDRETERINALVEKKRRLVERLQEYRTALITRTVTRGLPPEAARAAGLDPSPRLKPSGVEWLGDVPVHWEVRPLKRWVSLIQTGSTPPTREAHYFEDGAVPWHGPSSFSHDLLLRKSARSITRSAVRDGVARLFDHESSMIVTIGATIGKVGFVDKPSSCNQQITAVTFDASLVSPKYGAYQLKRLESMLRSIAPRATLPILDQSQVGSLAFAGPPRSEQRAIAAFLDCETARINALVDKVREAVERLQEQRTALITAAVTGKIDVRDAARAAALRQAQGERGGPFDKLRANGGRSW